MAFTMRFAFSSWRRPFLTQPNAPYLGPRLLIRSSSLSAIHRGLRHSERAQYGEPRSSDVSTSPRQRDVDAKSSRRAASSSRSSRGATTTRSRRASFDQETPDEFADKFKERRADGVRSWRQQQKLRKKLSKKAREKEEKKAREEQGLGRMTRRKRFTDPELTFAKKSMVYRLKFGDLKDKAEQLDIQEPVRPTSFRSRRREEMLGFHADDGAPKNQTRKPRPVSKRAEEGPRKPEHGMGSFERSSRGTGQGLKRFDQSSRRTGQPIPRDEDSRDQEYSARGPKKEMMNMTVKYTTAASQFLYGRSVVKSALEQGRRKLYKLYIYGGENRKDSKDNTIMTRLAEKHGVPITIIPNGEQRIMDKMSMGRPHNGFVLETSPLPQLPVKSLGKLEESASRLGFHVELDFQTKEEETINGTNTFVRRASDVTPKPFVLLLNEIVDPGNLGGILRTASYLGVDAVAITTRGSSTLTPVVLKSAAGAVEEVSLFTVDDSVKFIEASSKAGWRTFAAVAPPDRKLVKKHGDKFVSTEEIEAKSPLNEHPCLLVLGNEGYGLSKPIKVAADYELSVPRFVQNSCVDSLNVSVAAGLLCHAFVKEPLVAELPGTSKTVTVKDDLVKNSDVKMREEKQGQEGAEAIF